MKTTWLGAAVEMQSLQSRAAKFQLCKKGFDSSCADTGALHRPEQSTLSQRCHHLFHDPSSSSFPTVHSSDKHVHCALISVWWHMMWIQQRNLVGPGSLKRRGKVSVIIFTALNSHPHFENVSMWIAKNGGGGGAAAENLPGGKHTFHEPENQMNLRIHMRKTASWRLLPSSLLPVAAAAAELMEVGCPRMVSV